MARYGLYKKTFAIQPRNPGWPVRQERHAMIPIHAPPPRRALSLFLLIPVLISFLLAASPSLGKDYRVEDLRDPQLSAGGNFVCNPDALVSPEDVQSINALGRVLRSKGVELVVAAVGSIGEQDSRQFANLLFEVWKPGEAGKDNGLLVLLVTEPPQRSVVFEVGYGLEGVLPDASCYRLQQELMIPDLKEGRYSLALVKGITGITEHFASGGLLYAPEKPVAEEGPGLFFYLFCGLVLVAIIFIFLLIFRFILRSNVALLQFIRNRAGSGGGFSRTTGRSSYSITRSGSWGRSSGGSSWSSRGDRSGGGSSRGSRGGRSGGGGSRSSF